MTDKWLFIHAKDRFDHMYAGESAAISKKRNALVTLLEIFGFDVPFSISEVSEVTGFEYKGKWKTGIGKKTVKALTDADFLEETNQGVYRITIDGQNEAERIAWSKSWRYGKDRRRRPLDAAEHELLEATGFI